MCAKIYAAVPRTTPSRAVTNRMGHFFKCSDGIEFVESQFGEFDTIEGKLSIGCVDVKNAHDAIAAHDRLDRVVGADRRFTKIFFCEFRLWQFEGDRL